MEDKDKNEEISFLGEKHFSPCEIMEEKEKEELKNQMEIEKENKVIIIKIKEEIIKEKNESKNNFEIMEEKEKKETKKLLGKKRE